MQSIFLSQHFEETDRDLIEFVETLIESYGLLVLRGDALGGGNVSPGVRKRIARADACIAIATPHELKSAGKYSTFPWVQGEIVMARTLEKPCIAVVEKSVVMEGPYADSEKISYDTARPSPAFKKLAATIGAWRTEAGRQMKALVIPDTVAKALGKNVGKAVCEYRYYDGKGTPGTWQKASVVPSPGGPVVYLDGAHDDFLVELRLRIGRQSWMSSASAPVAHVKLVRGSRE